MKRTKMMNIKDWNIKRITGYEPRTVWYEYFTIADHEGDYAVRSLYRDIVGKYLDDIGLMKELAMILNWKAAEHDGKNSRLADLYKELWREIDHEIIKCFDDEDITYYLKETCGKKIIYYGWEAQ